MIPNAYIDEGDNQHNPASGYQSEKMLLRSMFPNAVRCGIDHGHAYDAKNINKGRQQPIDFIDFLPDQGSKVHGKSPELVVSGA